MEQPSHISTVDHILTPMPSTPEWLKPVATPESTPDLPLDLPTPVEKYHIEPLRFPKMTSADRQYQLVLYDTHFDSILDMVIEGTTLADIVQEHYPNLHLAGLRKWIHADSARLKRYRDAQEIGAGAIEDELLRLSDGAASELPEDVQRSKLRVSTRLKLLSIWDKTRYAPSTNIDVTRREEMGVDSLKQLASNIIRAKSEATSRVILDGQVTEVSDANGE